jgi:hypothetical protein
MPPTLSISNRLLRSLTADDLDPLRPHLHAVTLSHRQALSKPGTPISGDPKVPCPNDILRGFRGYIRRLLCRLR